MQVLDNIRLGSVSHVQKKWDHYSVDHESRFCSKNKSSKVLTVGDKKCQVCGQEAHSVMLADGRSIFSNHTVSCLEFKSADHAGKVELLHQVKNKVTLFCKHCSSSSHKAKTCYSRTVCKHCQGKHLTELHEFQALLNCSVSSVIIMPACMSLQDVHI